MAEKSSRVQYQYPVESRRIDRTYPEEIREEDEDDDNDDNDENILNVPDHQSYQAIPSSMTSHHYNHVPNQNMVLPSTLNNGQPQFNLFMDRVVTDEDDGTENTQGNIVSLLPPTTIHIQRVSSEDELRFSSKRKRAKFVGPYLFGDVIGRGSYAKVKECLDRRNLCRRAVKIMQRRRLRRTPDGEKMAATEIRILKILNHQNIIRLYDFMRNDEKQKLYLFIDLCVVSLQEMLDESQTKHQLRAFPIWQAHGYFIQLIHGLEYLHSKFIIHNDIKPGNLLITVDHQLKITDFGTAEQLDLFSVDDTIKRSKGTPAFQCPEIANGDDTYRGFSIDIWSCGVTLFNLVTGKLPFEGETIFLLFQNIGAGIYKIPDDIDPNLKSLINGLLNVNKELRCTIEEIKHHTWFRRRPPRTLDIVEFPVAALTRFQNCTMYDYLAALHEPEDENEIEESQIINITDGSSELPNDSQFRNQNQTSIVAAQNHSTNAQRQRSTRSFWNCSCGRSMSDDQIGQRHRTNRNCTLS